MWIIKITKRKMQFTIVMLIAMIATAILTACISFTLETRSFVNEYYSNENCPMLFSVVKTDNCRDMLLKDDKASKVIDKIVTGKAKYITDNFYINNMKISNEGNFAYGMSSLDTMGYNVAIAKGEHKIAPADDEIWVCSIFADNYDIEVGDKFSIGKGIDYTVSAIVSSPLCSSGLIDSYPFYLNEKALEDIPETELYSALIYAKGDDITQKEFQDAMPKEFDNVLQLHLDKQTLNLCLSILSGIFGGVGIAAGIIIIVVSMIVYRYLVRATISKEYNMIGIYKSIGKENKEIRKTYLNAYMFSGIVGMIIGFFLARPLTSYLSNVVLGYIPGFKLTNYTTITGLLVIIFMCLLILINLWSELGKIKNISPIQAINYRNLSSKEKLCKSVIPNAHTSLSMSINEIFKRKGMSVLVIMILTVSIYIELMSCAVSITLSNYSNDTQIWENLPKYDCIIKQMNSKKALDFVKNSDDVEDYVQAMLDPICTGMEIEGSEWTADEAHPMVYENFTKERYEDVPFQKGRICLESGEITASQQFLDGVGKKAGDYIEISNGTLKKDFLIAGSYSAMMKGGISFYMNASDYNYLGYENNYTTILVFLKDGVKYKDFAVFSILNIINLIHTQNKENRRKYGIMKAMGFTTGYLCRESIFRLSIEYIDAIILTLILHKLVSPLLFGAACGVRFIYSPIWLPIAVCGGTYIVLLIIVLVMLSTVRKIKPVELIEE